MSNGICDDCGLPNELSLRKCQECGWMETHAASVVANRCPNWATTYYLSFVGRVIPIKVPEGLCTHMERMGQ